MLERASARANKRALVCAGGGGESGGIIARARARADSRVASMRRPHARGIASIVRTRARSSRQHVCALASVYHRAEHFSREEACYLRLNLWHLELSVRQKRHR